MKGRITKILIITSFIVSLTIDLAVNNLTALRYSGTWSSEIKNHRLANLTLLLVKHKKMKSVEIKTTSAYICAGTYSLSKQLFTFSESKQNLTSFSYLHIDPITYHGSPKKIMANRDVNSYHSPLNIYNNLHYFNRKSKTRIRMNNCQYREVILRRKTPLKYQTSRFYTNINDHLNQEFAYSCEKETSPSRITRLKYIFARANNSFFNYNYLLNHRNKSSKNNEVNKFYKERYVGVCGNNNNNNTSKENCRKNATKFIGKIFYPQPQYQRKIRSKKMFKRHSLFFPAVGKTPSPNIRKRLHMFFQRISGENFPVINFDVTPDTLMSTLNNKKLSAARDNNIPQFNDALYSNFNEQWQCFVFQYICLWLQKPLLMPPCTCIIVNFITESCLVTSTTSKTENLRTTTLQLTTVLSSTTCKTSSITGTTCSESSTTCETLSIASTTGSESSTTCETSSIASTTGSESSTTSETSSIASTTDSESSTTCETSSIASTTGSESSTTSETSSIARTTCSRSSTTCATITLDYKSAEDMALRVLVLSDYETMTTTSTTTIATSTSETTVTSPETTTTTTSSITTSSTTTTTTTKTSSITTSSSTSTTTTTTSSITTSSSTTTTTTTTPTAPDNAAGATTTTTTITIACIKTTRKPPHTSPPRPPFRSSPSFQLNPRVHPLPTVPPFSTFILPTVTVQTHRHTLITSAREVFPTIEYDWICLYGECL